MRALRATCLLGGLAAVLLGCAETQSFLRTEPAAPLPPSSADAVAPPQPVALRVQDHLGWPFQLERLIVTVDGKTLQNVDLPRSGAAPGEIRVDVALPPGEHALSLLAVTQLATTPSGHRCVMELRSDHAFVTRAGAPAELTADLFTRGVQRDFRDRFAVAYRFQGRREESARAQAIAVTSLPCTTDRYPDLDAEVTVLPQTDPLAVAPRVAASPR
jgi:hypothetical protein